MLQYSTLTQKSEDVFFNYEILIFAYKLSFYAQKIFRAWLILKLYFAMSFSGLIHAETQYRIFPCCLKIN